MADGVAFIDGEYVAAHEARIPLFDLGFTRGDAVYDTVSVWKGRFFRLDDHVARFLRSCAGARLTCPHPPEELKRILAECVHRAGLEDAYVQMIVTRGEFVSMTKRDPRLCRNRFVGFALPYIWIVPPERQEVGIDLAMVDNRRTPKEAIDPRVKNFNWMDLQRGLFEALDRGADMAVLCTPAGHLAEGPGFNLFVVKDGALSTPRSNVLEGMTRQTVLDLAGELGVPARAGGSSARRAPDGGRGVPLVDGGRDHAGRAGRRAAARRRAARARHDAVPDALLGQARGGLAGDAGQGPGRGTALTGRGRLTLPRLPRGGASASRALPRGRPPRASAGGDPR